MLQKLRMCRGGDHCCWIFIACTWQKHTVLFDSSTWQCFNSSPAPHPDQALCKPFPLSLLHTTMTSTKSTKSNKQTLPEPSPEALLTALKRSALTCLLLLSRRVRSLQAEVEGAVLSVRQTCTVRRVWGCDVKSILHIKQLTLCIA